MNKHKSEFVTINTPRDKYMIVHKSVDSNCFTLFELISTAQRTEAQLFAMKYVSVKQSIFIMVEISHVSLWSFIREY